MARLTDDQLDLLFVLCKNYLAFEDAMEKAGMRYAPKIGLWRDVTSALTELQERRAADEPVVDVDIHDLRRGSGSTTITSLTDGG